MIDMMEILLLANLVNHGVTTFTLNQVSSDGLKLVIEKVDPLKFLKSVSTEIIHKISKVIVKALKI
jgi:hypothetical protein